MRTKALWGLWVGLAALGAEASEPFAWTQEQRLEGKGGALVWQVKRGADETVIEGRHPKWSVVHRCAPDGTPRETVRKVGTRTSRLLWTRTGVEYTWDVAAGKPPKKIDERGLWDGDTLEVRLAGIDWTKTRKVELRVVDTEKDAGDVVPLRAELEGQEKCALGPCNFVRLRYTGFGAIFVKPWDYRFGTGSGAPYLRYEHDGEEFAARALPEAR